MKQLAKYLLRMFFRSGIPDLLLFPFAVVSGLLLKIVRGIGLDRLTLTRKALVQIGMLPVRDHYYEPLFNEKYLRHSLEEDRLLPGINWNISAQCSLLESLRFGHELSSIPDHASNNLSFHFVNGSFESGDAEFWYNMIRFKKPARIIEVGSGHSTRMARIAIDQNTKDDPAYRCQHICIEPFEMPWLEHLNIEIKREKVERLPLSFFSSLQENDILFIDSSHVIRPQGDVLYELLQVLPTLNKGVIVHFHDIFSPKDYKHDWLFNKVRLWNEQYLLEAFLSNNPSWSILSAVNHLKHHHFDALKTVCPRLTRDREPASFYIQKLHS